MSVMNLDAEIREYQWRRKFEAGPRRTSRVPVVVSVLLPVFIAVARALSWW